MIGRHPAKSAYDSAFNSNDAIISLQIRPTTLRRSTSYARSDGEASAHRLRQQLDALTGQTLRSLVGHSDSVRGCAFSPDGKLVVSASGDRTLRVWDALTGQTLATFFADEPMFCCAVYGEMIAAGGDQCEGRLYIDGARAQYPFPFGSRAHIEIAQESLKLFL